MTDGTNWRQLVTMREQLCFRLFATLPRENTASAVALISMLKLHVGPLGVEGEFALVGLIHMADRCSENLLVLGEERAVTIEAACLPRRVNASPTGLDARGCRSPPAQKLAHEAPKKQFLCRRLKRGPPSARALFPQTGPMK